MEERIKHVWDPAINEFVPERTRPRRIIKLWEWFKSWSTINKLAALAAVLRIYHLGAGSFWYDEGVSVVFARLPWPRMIAATAADVHPPGYYIILWLLARTGIPLTEITARIPSMIFSVLVVYLAAALAKKFELNQRGQFVLMVWVLISPLQLHYAQEARMYSLLQLEILAAIYFVLDRRRAFLSFVMVGIVYTHNYGLFYLPAMAIIALQREIKQSPQTININNLYALFKPWIIWFIIPVLAWLPWLLVLLNQMGTISGGYWIQPVTLPAIIFVIYQLLFAYSMPPTFQGLGVMLSCGVILYTAWRIYKDRPSYWPELTALVVTPLALAVILSIIWRPLLLFRGLIGTSIPLLILVIKAIEGIKVPYKVIYAYTLIGFTLLAGTVGHYTFNAANKGLTKTWVHEIKQEYRQGDVILALNDNGIIALMTYAPELPLYKMTGCGADPLGSLSQGTRAALEVKESEPDLLIGKGIYYDIPDDVGYSSYSMDTEYNRIWFVSTIAPISPKCEIDTAAKLINSQDYNAELIKELAATEYAQAGIYLITSKEIY